MFMPMIMMVARSRPCALSVSTSIAPRMRDPPRSRARTRPASHRGRSPQPRLAPRPAPARHGLDSHVFAAHLDMAHQAVGREPRIPSAARAGASARISDSSASAFGPIGSAAAPPSTSRARRFVLQRLGRLDGIARHRRRQPGPPTRTWHCTVARIGALGVDRRRPRSDSGSAPAWPGRSG